MKLDKPIIIAIDGPAGAGKSTVGKSLAAKLGALYIDTGAMYRTIALLGLREGIIDPEATAALTPDQEARLTALAEATTVRLEGDPYHLRVFAGPVEVTGDIRTPLVSRFASIVSAVAGVRAAMTAQQRAMGAAGSVVMDGRDIGTHVFPNAQVKIFLVASVEARARRRFAEQQARGDGGSYEATLADVTERDHRDSTRAVAPLRPADDAVHLDTSDLAPDRVVEAMLSIIQKKLTGPEPA